MMTIKITVLAIAAVMTALSAGLFYSYSCSVNPGLGRLPDDAYIKAMQAINRAILNPVFFLSFMGTAFLLPASTIFFAGQPSSARFICLLLASVAYLVGVIGVTIFGNVPLNEALDKFDLSGVTTAEITARRAAFEIPWNRLHEIRTWAAFVSLVLVVIACLRNNA
jgi:uncharacterized membrane protein